MENKKSLITSLVLDRFIDNYSENEYRSAWDKLQTFLNDNKDNPDLFRESAFDAEWLDAVFCDILGYPKKLKSREYWTTNGVGKQEERVDGVFYKHGNQMVKMVIELKALDTPDLFKKDGKSKLSPITQGAKYLFQTPGSELAVVSNFDHVVVFDRKEEFRQSWSLFNMTFDQFKEFYLIMSFNSFYGNLTKLMIDQSEDSEKDVDEDFYSLVVSLHKTLHNKFKTEYADDLFNKFIALALLEDSGALPPSLVKTVYGRKTDFDQNLKSHWEVFSAFFKSLKNNKSSREYLNIDDTVSQLPVWQNISYLGRIKVPKAILDQVVSLSEYNLKSVPLPVLFFSIAKRLYNAYDCVSMGAGSSDSSQFEFYAAILQDQYTPVDVCLSFACGRWHGETNHLIELYNTLSHDHVQCGQFENLFTLKLDVPITQNISSVIDSVDLTDENMVQCIIKNIDGVEVFDFQGFEVAKLNFTTTPKPDFTMIVDNQTHTILRDSVKTKIRVLSSDERAWLETYNCHARPFSEFAAVTNKDYAPLQADFKINLSTGAVTKRDESGRWGIEEEWYESNEVKQYVRTSFENLDLILGSTDFIKYLDLTDTVDLRDSKISAYLLSDEFMQVAKRAADLKETINLYEFKLDRLQKINADEVEIIRVEMKLEELYHQQKENKTFLV